MRILLFTEKEDYARVIGFLADEIYKNIEVSLISQCQLANVALSEHHDLVVIDDRLFELLNDDCIYVMEKSRIEVVVFLQQKENIKRYLNLNVVDYFVSPLKWDKINERLRIQFKRVTALMHHEKPFSTQNKFVLKTKSEVYFINHHHILFFHKEDKSVKVFTTHEVFESHDSLKKILEQVPKEFIRVHSSYIVNFNRAKSIVDIGNRSYEILFDTGKEKAYMSRKKAEEMIKDDLNHYRLSFITEIRKDH